MNAGELIERILNLIYPPRCVACHRRGVLFCPGCARSCRAAYQESAAPAEGPFGLYAFQPPLQDAIHALKYKSFKGLAQPLGQLLAAEMARLKLLPQDVALAWVPLHVGRQRERGFNQAELLTRQAARLLGHPLAPGLRRVRATKPQVGLSGAERNVNLQGAFEWGGTAAPPRRVAVVDDVLTTGATFTACKEALLAAGAEAVTCIALGNAGTK